VRAALRRTVLCLLLVTTALEAHPPGSGSARVHAHAPQLVSGPAPVSVRSSAAARAAGREPRASVLPAATARGATPIGSAGKARAPALPGWSAAARPLLTGARGNALRVTTVAGVRGGRLRVNASLGGPATFDARRLVRR